MTAVFGQALYASDNGSTYNIRLKLANYTASGLSTGDDSVALYPHRWTPRKVHGVSSTGKRASIPCLASSDIFNGGASTFSLGGVTFQITGRSGEKRPNLALPFA